MADLQVDIQGEAEAVPAIPQLSNVARLAAQMKADVAENVWWLKPNEDKLVDGWLNWELTRKLKAGMFLCCCSSLLISFIIFFIFLLRIRNCW